MPNPTPDVPAVVPNPHAVRSAPVPRAYRATEAARKSRSPRISRERAARKRVDFVDRPCAVRVVCQTGTRCRSKRQTAYSFRPVRLTLTGSNVIYSGEPIARGKTVSSCAARSVPRGNAQITRRGRDLT